MKKQGSPGGILAIAVGALFLSLGWTGRYAAVWEALRTGESASNASNNSGARDSNGNPIPSAPPADAPPRGNAKPPVNAPTSQLPGGRGFCKTTDYGITQSPYDASFMRKNEWRCYAPENVILVPTTQGGVHCPTGFRAGEGTGGITYCVRVGAGEHPITGGGDVVDESDYTVNMSPTGALGRQYQPNVKGRFFDA